MPGNCREEIFFVHASHRSYNQELAGDALGKKSGMVPYMLVLPATHPGQFVIFLGRPSTAAGVVIHQIAEIQFFYTQAVMPAPLY